MRSIWKRNISHTVQPVVAAFCLAALFGCGSSTDDPDTISRSKLSPPLKLLSVTGSGQIELRWSAQNFESELRGYDVFMVADTTLSAIAANTNALPSYPRLSYTESTLADASIPRCEDNNEFFKLFGILAPSEEDCDDSLFGSDEEDESTNSLQGPSFGLTPTGVTLLQDDELDSVVDAKLSCFDPDSPTTELGSALVSLPKGTGEYNDGQGIQRCLIKQDRNGNALQNGTTYVFLVVAVLGDDADEISWSSNLIEDTPAPVLLSETLTIESDKYITLALPADISTGSATVGAAADCPANNLCKLNGTNSTTAAATLAIARDSNSNSYPQRLFLSSSASSGVAILYRGPITFDPLNAAAIATRVPGDSAVASSGSVYTSNGLTIPFYDNSVFDIAYTVGTSTYYGKLIIDNISYVSDKDSAASFSATIVMQPKAGSLHYLYGH